MQSSNSMAVSVGQASPTRPCKGAHILADHDNGDVLTICVLLEGILDCLDSGFCSQWRSQAQAACVKPTSDEAATIGTLMRQALMLAC